MPYPLRTNWVSTGDPFVASDMDNTATLVNTIWTALAGVPSAPSARAATTGAETFTIAAGSVTTINGTTVDGVSVAVGDYVLVKDAPATTGAGSPNSTQPANGLYKATAIAANITLARATVMSSAGGAATPAGMLVWVMAGTANIRLGWIVSTPSSGAAFTYGTTAIGFTQAAITAVGIQTLTNKRLTKRVGSVATSATPAINTDLYDAFKITALATAITSWTITGTPTDTQEFWLFIKDNGTSQTLAWTGFTIIESGAAKLPSASTPGKQMILKFMYDAARTALVLLAVDTTGY